MVEKGKAIVANPWACTYSGLCELACPRKAIERPFEIILVSSPQMKSGKLQPKREKENKS
jgi:ferredoxin